VIAPLAPISQKVPLEALNEPQRQWTERLHAVTGRIQFLDFLVYVTIP